MNGVLAPHNDEELSLMLTGKKQMAYFCEEAMCEEFAQPVKEGKIHKHIYYYSGMIMIIFTLPEHDHKAPILQEAIVASFEAETFDEQLTQEMLIGALLGYSYEDVFCFIQHVKQSNSR
ncbi:hypothetical protein CBF23_009550 [Marinomonas agarivorans]|nr:hypothetical protein CBF23_009550 [Marinomonas agarivorans]